MDRLTLKPNTTLTDIGKFMAEQKNQGASVLAKKDGDGNTVLYTRQGEKEYKGFSGKLDQIKDGFKSLFLDGKKAEFGKEALADFISQSTPSIKEGLEEKSNKVGKGDDAVTAVFGLLKGAPVFLRAQTQVSANEATRLFSCLELLTDGVSRVLDAKIERSEKQAPPLPQTNNKSLGEGQVWGDHPAEKTTTPKLEIGGKTYVCDKLLGRGGYGAVFSYKAEDGSRLAVKIPPDSQSNQKNLAATNHKAQWELANSLKAIEGNPNASGPSQHVVLDNGLVALVSEVLPNGDLTGLAQKVSSHHFASNDRSEMPSGMIGDLERKLIGLTMLQDSAKGLSVINETKGLTHGDMKSQNVMLDENGVAKLIDLGETTTTKDIQVYFHDFPDNDMYLAPEARRLPREMKERTPGVSSANTQMFQSIVDEYMDVFGINSKNYDPELLKENTDYLNGFVKDLSEDLDSLVVERNNSDRGLSKSFDTFGLGTMGFELLVGGRATQDLESELAVNKKGTIQSSMQKWSNTGNDFIGEGGVTQRTSGDPEVDKLLNGMLKSDPKERLSPKDVRDHALMDTPGVGSPEVRRLIIALASGNAEAIDNARDAVLNRYSDI